MVVESYIKQVLGHFVNAIILCNKIKFETAIPLFMYSKQKLGRNLETGLTAIFTLL